MELDQKYAPIAVTLLRVALGIMFLAHSVLLKLITYTLPGTAAYLESFGWPGYLAYVAFFPEAVGGVMLVLGIQARWVALALTPILLGAIGFHSGFGWVFDSLHGGWEYPAFLSLLTVCQFLLGDGRYVLVRSSSFGILAAKSA